MTKITFKLLKFTITSSTTSTTLLQAIIACNFKEN